MIERRQASMDKYLKACKQIATQSDVSKAILVADYIKDHSTFGIPIVNGFGAEILVPEDMVGIVPVVREDLRFPYWRRFIMSNATAQYDTVGRWVAIRADQEINPNWCGLLMLHEGKHVYDYITKPYDTNNKNIFYPKECATYTLQFEVMQKLGGKKYEDYMSILIEELKRLKKKKGLDYYSLNQVEVDSEVLNTNFGPIHSNYEKTSRETDILLHGIFGLIDLQSGGNKQKTLTEKSKLLHRWYSSTGVVQQLI